MIFKIENTNSKVQEGYAIAGEILASGEFFDRLTDVSKFTYTKMDQAEVVGMVMAQQEGIITGLTPKIPVKQEYINDSAIARVYSNRPGIWVNDKFTRSSNLKTYIENGAHESMHIFGLGHGSNFLPTSLKGRVMMKVLLEFEDKYQSVPLMVQKIVSQIAKERRLIK